MRHINAPAFKAAEYEFTVYCATIENGATFQDILEPEYWMHVADRVRPSDVIRAIAADQTFYAELLVLRKSRTEVFVAVLNHVDLTKFSMGEDLSREVEKYDISWGGPANKFRVTYRRTGDVIRDGFDNEAAARTFLVTDHLTQKPLTSPGVRIGASAQRARGDEPMPERENTAA